MTVGSLFAGIGGFDLGFERAGFEIRWQVEIDPFCRAVLEQHWPNMRRYEDVRECCGSLLRAKNGRCAECGRHDWLPWVDVLCGGFPCQDVSDCGAKAGIDGAQSGLWREMSRVVGELRPRYVVVENVTGLLDRGMGRVLGDLARLGYDAEWSSLLACALGAPHVRQRVFLVAYPDAGGRRASRPAQMEDASAIRAVARGESGGITRWASHWTDEPAISRVADGIPAVVDRGAALGNAIVPQIAEWIAERIKAAEGFAK